LHIGANIFKKLKEFGEFYLQLPDDHKKFYEDALTIMTHPETKDWNTNFLVMTNQTLIELIDYSVKIKLDALAKLCSVSVSKIVQNTDIDGLQTLFTVDTSSV
jgi:hypothetical protein